MPNRRTATLVSLAAALLLSLLPSRAPAQEAGAKPAAKPNIVVILADDMGFSDVSPYGGEINTPHIAQLAAGGIRFTQFYNTGRCCPTRAALLTGLYPHQVGVGHMTNPIGDFPGYRGNLSHDARTVAEVLKPAGYSTYMTGKWHVTSEAGPHTSKDNWPLQRGFDRYYGTVKGGGNYYDPAMLTRDNTPINPYADPEYKPRGSRFYYTDAIADHSARFIREHHDNVGDRPFFLYVAFTAPHWPLHAPAEAVAKYKGKYDGGYEPVRAARFERMKAMGLVDATAELPPAPVKWDGVKNKEWEARCMEVYAAQVELMDAGIGRIVDALRETGQLDETLILFLADNGASPEKQGRTTQPERANAKPIPSRPADQVQLEIATRHTADGRPVRNGPGVMPGPDDTFIAYGEGWANVSNTPFREYKSWMHEGGVGTPLIAHWPAGISRKGELERQPGHLVDLMTTFVELAGATYPAEHDGRPVPPAQGVSLTPAFRGQPLDRGRPIFFEHQGNRAIRDGDWKLVAKKDAPWELYDLAKDRAELHDLAAAQPERVKAMSDAWQRWAEASQVLPLNPGRVARAKQGGKNAAN